MERLLSAKSKPFVCCVLYMLYAPHHRLLLCMKKSANLFCIHSHSHSQSTHQLFKYDCSMGDARDAMINKWKEKEKKKKHKTFPFVAQSIHRMRNAHTSAKVWIVILLKLIFVFALCLWSSSVVLLLIQLCVCLSVCCFFFFLGMVACSTFVFPCPAQLTHCSCFHEQAF